METAPETMTEKEIRTALAGSVIQTKSAPTLVGIGGRMYKRESDGLYYLLDNGAGKQRASDGP